MSVPTSTCLKCEGTGKLKEYSWNKGGICFECGGDGKVTTLSTHKFNKQEDPRKFLKHVSTRDMIDMIKSGSGKINSYDKMIDFRREMLKRAEKLGLDYDFGVDAMELINSTEKALDKAEKDMPTPWKKGAYNQAGKVAEVPAHWLSKFQGNSLRRDSSEMKEFAEKLKEEGLKDPVMIIIGQEDRRVSIGEGNHRTFAFIEAGLDKVPARVVRQRTNSGGVYYDKMERVPQYDYFKADASPEEVFDTFWDADYLPEEPSEEVSLDALLAESDEFDDEDFDLLDDLDEL
jgi:hypothetical protein